MPKGAVDRRVVRTRAGLHQALIALVLRKGYAATTVEDICETANVGRSTFYQHYAGKDALMRGGLAHLREALFGQRTEAPAGGKPAFAFSRPMFEHARSQIELYRAHLKGGGELAIETIKGIIAEGVRAELAAAPIGEGWDAESREVAVEYVAGGFIALLTWWLDRDAQVPVGRMDALFRRMAAEGLAGLQKGPETPGD